MNEAAGVGIEVHARSSGIDLAPDMMTRQQFFDLARTTARSGEQRLLVRILEDATDVLFKGRVRSDNPYVQKKRAERTEEAHRWLWGAAAPISFAMCCEAFDWDESWLRTAIIGVRAPMPRRSPVEKREHHPIVPARGRR